VSSDRMLWRVADAAEAAGVTARTMYRFLAEGVVPPTVVVRAGRSIYVRRVAFLAWLAGRATATEGDSTNPASQSPSREVL
jgi:hypothetical protein